MIRQRIEAPALVARVLNHTHHFGSPRAQPHVPLGLAGFKSKMNKPNFFASNWYNLHWCFLLCNLLIIFFDEGVRKPHKFENVLAYRQSMINSGFIFVKKYSRK